MLKSVRRRKGRKKKGRQGRKKVKKGREGLREAGKRHRRDSMVK